MGTMAVADVADRPAWWGASVRAHHEWRAADLDNSPDDGLQYEIIDGVLVVSPAPLRRHQIAVGQLHLLLAAACPDDLEVIVAPADWVIDDTTVVEPDVMLTRKAGVDDPIETPVLVVEVASHSTARIDRTLKFQLYAGAGAAHYWIVDPGSSTRAPSVEVYDLTDGQYRLQGSASGDETITVTGAIQVDLPPQSLITR